MAPWLFRLNLPAALSDPTAQPVANNLGDLHDFDGQNCGPVVPFRGAFDGVGNRPRGDRKPHFLETSSSPEHVVVAGHQHRWRTTLAAQHRRDRKSTRLNSSHLGISY